MGRRFQLAEIPKDMKTIGVLGGMGPQATIDFEQRVHRLSQHYLPQKFSTGYPPMVVGYFREVPIRMNEDGSFADPAQPSPNLLIMAKQIGAVSDFLVITSNTPHLFEREIEEASGKKILSIVAVTVEEVKRKVMKRVGLLAIGLTLRNRLYQDPLEELGVEWEVIPQELEEELDHAIFAVMEGRSDESSREVARGAVNYFEQLNVEGVILGCSELPILLGHTAEAERMINPSELLAEATVRKSIGLI